MPRGAPRRSWGPGWVVAAAFVGPGTVTTATLAGAKHSYALVWALVAAVALAIVLQETAARVTLATGQPLAAVVRARFAGRARVVAASLVVVALGVGNAAFEAGNLTGAALGVSGLVPGRLTWRALAVADAAFLLLWFGRARFLERALQGLVAVMGVAFVATLAFARIDWLDTLAGFAPRIPPGGAAVALALLGTTVVPYNLYLHGALVRAHGWRAGDLGTARRDTALAVAVGGLISLAILLTSAAVLRGADVAGPGDMAAQLRPLLGPFAAATFSVGLLAAGLTSAVTAPLAAAYAITAVLGWTADPAEPRFRAVWAAVLAAGLVPPLVGVDPVGAILAAQALNGLLLPLSAGLLVLVANDRRSMGSLRNGPVANAAAALALALALVLGAKLLAAAWVSVR